MRILANYVNNDNRMNDGGQAEIHLLDSRQDMIWYGEGYPNFYTDRIDEVCNKYDPDILFYCGSNLRYSQTAGIENVKCPIVVKIRLRLFLTNWIALMLLFAVMAMWEYKHD